MDFLYGVVFTLAVESICLIYATEKLRKATKDEDRRNEN